MSTTASPDGSMPVRPAALDPTRRAHRADIWAESVVQILRHRPLSLEGILRATRGKIASHLADMSVGPQLDHKELAQYYAEEAADWGDPNQ